jgi:hypothetical protein
MGLQMGGTQCTLTGSVGEDDGKQHGQFPLRSFRLVLTVVWDADIV